MHLVSSYAVYSFIVHFIFISLTKQQIIDLLIMFYSGTGASETALRDPDEVVQVRDVHRGLRLRPC